LLVVLDTSDSMSQGRTSIPERRLYFGSHYVMLRLILTVLTMFQRAITMGFPLFCNPRELFWWLRGKIKPI
jgi:hypothetical protein